MEPPSYKRSVVDGNVAMRRIPVMLSIFSPCPRHLDFSVNLRFFSQQQRLSLSSLTSQHTNSYTAREFKSLSCMTVKSATELYCITEQNRLMPGLGSNIT